MKKLKQFLLSIILSLSIVTDIQAQNYGVSFADLAEQLLPSVVNISTTHDKNNEEDEINEIEQNIETTIKSVFNEPKTNKVSLGSGFIISKDGYIITNNHVIDEAKTITVTLSDNTSLEANVIGKDSKTDIALIKVNTEKTLLPVKTGDSDKIRIGDWILAIGNPFGLGGSVTAGIISAKSRDIETGPYDNYIQTDASINQGSSGGPMFNMQGEVIGINSAIFSTNGGNMGVGFAIPINLADFVITQLKEKGQVKRGWIGIKMQPYESNNARQVIISSVNENSGAAKAGIQAGDIMIKFDNHNIDGTKNLSRMVAETPIGKKVNIEVLRQFKKHMFVVTIEEMPQKLPDKIEKKVINQKNVQKNSILNLVGLAIENITPEIRQKYNLAEDIQGVMVKQVEDDSDAQLKGIKKGDIITQIDKQMVLDADDAKLLILTAERENRRPILLQINNKQNVHYVAIKMMPKLKRN